jgi:hypothetical protein
MIRETIVTTTNAAGTAHIAPLGIIADGESSVIAPFRPSTTLDNLRAVPFAAANHHRRRARIRGLPHGARRLAHNSIGPRTGAAACGRARVRPSSSRGFEQ